MKGLTIFLASKKLRHRFLPVRHVVGIRHGGKRIAAKQTRLLLELDEAPVHDRLRPGPEENQVDVAGGEDVEQELEERNVKPAGEFDGGVVLGLVAVRVEVVHVEFI